jgi:L-amino acid N-acyltransferase YncA
MLMATRVKLKDGTQAVIRRMRRDDLERSVAFFQAMPPEDRLYLRVDVSKPEFVERRIRGLGRGKIKRLVAIAEDQIIADGALELQPHEWKEHVGEIRLIVARPYQRKGLGLLMARDLFLLAAKAKVEEIVVRMMRPQRTAKRIFRRLGFHQEVVLPEYVKDLHGQKQDLILMRCDLKALWEDLEHYLAESDWQRVR